MLVLHHLLLLLHLSSVTDHLGVGVQILVSRLHHSIEGSDFAAVLPHKFLGIFLFSEGPLGSLGHDAHFTSTDDVESLFGIDQGFRTIVANHDGLWCLVNVQDKINGCAANAACPNACPVVILNVHPAVAELLSVHATKLTARMISDITLPLRENHASEETQADYRSDSQ